MMVKSVTPQEAQAMLAQGAVLVDIRSADEYAREHIAAAQHVPAARLQSGAFSQTVVFHCRSGHRTKLHAQTLRDCGQADVYILEGGINAWKKAGLPVVRNAMPPIDIQRQVQIIAGTMILLGFILGRWVYPGFYWLSALVGAGLLFAGLSGFCGLAVLLGKMPWNRNKAS